MLITQHISKTRKREYKDVELQFLLFHLGLTKSLASLPVIPRT